MRYHVVSADDIQHIDTYTTVLVVIQFNFKWDRFETVLYNKEVHGTLWPIRSIVVDLSDEDLTYLKLAGKFVQEIHYQKLTQHIINALSEIRKVK